MSLQPPYRSLKKRLSGPSSLGFSKAWRQAHVTHDEVDVVSLAFEATRVTCNSGLPELRLPRICSGPSSTASDSDLLAGLSQAHEIANQVVIEHRHGKRYVSM